MIMFLGEKLICSHKDPSSTVNIDVVIRCDLGGLHTETRCL